MVYKIHTRDKNDWSKISVELNMKQKYNLKLNIPFHLYTDIIETGEVEYNKSNKRD